MISSNPYADLGDASLAVPPVVKKITIKLEGESRTKRKRIDEETSTMDEILKEAASVDSFCGKDVLVDVSEVKEPEIEIDFKKTITTLLSHVNNTKKLPKAITLTVQLVNAKFTTSNDADLYSFLESIFSISSLINTTHSDNKIFISSIKDLMSCVWSKVNLFSSSNHKYHVHTWYLRYFIRYELSTDDSFLFFKTCQPLKSCIESLPKDSHEPMQPVEVEGELGGEDTVLPTSDMYRQRLTVILECLTVAYKSYFRAWAKPTLDNLFETAARHRRAFPPDLRESLDELTTSITHAQRKAAALGEDYAGGATRTIRTYNSTAHPLLQKNTGILR